LVEIESRMIRAGLPARHRTTTLAGKGRWRDTYTRASEVVRECGMACLLGPRGTGKTQMATNIARAFIEARLDAGIADDLPVVYVRAMELFAALREAFRKGSEQTEVSALKRFRVAPLLIIDEIQERGETEFEDRMLVLLIDQRYGDMVPTVLLSNLTRAELGVSLGRSIVSRIQETGTVLECNWQSFRAKAQAGDRA
jgi:DNA replication protein DnaC